LTYARHAQIGQVHYTRISSDISFNLQAPDPAEILANMASAKDVADALDSYNPPQPGYKALKKKLAEVRARRGESSITRIDDGPLLKVGMRDARVPQLRERLGVEGESADTTFDKTLSAAVKKFQRQHGLSASGHLNSSTVAALNGPRRDREADIIIANMERWRWLPRDLGKAYVMVNLPDYTLRVVDNGVTVWSTKIVIGKPSMPTPLLSETMKYITVNPTWNVPPSIVQNEYLPALQQDPNALERIGLKVEQNRDGTIHIYQPPGDRNALGRIRFNFPNKFLVYQHDTPDKHLFSQSKRAYSHGCMRVQDPLKYGEVLLSIANPKDGYTAERLHRMFGSEERNIQFHTPIPVHLTYQTAFVDDAGKLQIRDDVYGRDSRVIAALKGDERRIADIPVERRREASNTRPQVFRMPSAPPMPRYNSAGGFFGFLFR
jgi:murein L,D-transpeptidase YcbB/YkuD